MAAAALAESEASLDVGALSRAMVEMGTDATKAGAFGKLGRKRALERFSAKALVRSTDRLYRELLAEKGLSPPPALKTSRETADERG